MSRLRSDISDAAAAVRRAACPLPGARHYDRILSWIGEASVVLLGESTHGTQDFYAARATLTRRLIEERGFAAVAIEGDWPDALRVNRYVQGRQPAMDTGKVLSGFARFPTWMWRNTAVAEFVAWLHEFNAGQTSPERRAGFYGLDLYSLHASMRGVVDYLEKTAPELAAKAREAYGCFEHFGEDTESYGWMATEVAGLSCEEAVARQLVELQKERANLVSRDAERGEDEYFYAEQNARLALNAERYYRTMHRGRAASWNLRDEHMADTLEQLLQHLERRGQVKKVVVWAHNSHIGDAQATEMGRSGELNLGQLVRERHGEAAKLIGFTTHRGTVIAANDWGGVAEEKQVRPALAGSYEDLFHATGISRFFLPLTGDGPARSALAERRLERAIGVIYRPETERLSHYFEANLAEQFDAVVHFDETSAVQPLELESKWDAAEAPETFPTGV